MNEQSQDNNTGVEALESTDDSATKKSEKTSNFDFEANGLEISYDPDFSVTDKKNFRLNWLQLQKIVEWAQKASLPISVNNSKVTVNVLIKDKEYKLSFTLNRGNEDQIDWEVDNQLPAFLTDSYSQTPLSTDINQFANLLLGGKAHFLTHETYENEWDGLLVKLDEKNKLQNPTRD